MKWNTAQCLVPTVRHAIAIAGIADRSGAEFPDPVDSHFCRSAAVLRSADVPQICAFSSAPMKIAPIKTKTKMSRAETPVERSLEDVLS